MSNLMTSIGASLRASPYLVVACLSGPAVGGGAEIAMHADVRISSPTVGSLRFAQAAMCVSTGWGGGRRLAAVAGRSKALRLLATSETLSPVAALGLGIVDFIAEEGESAEQAALRILKNVQKIDGSVMAAIKGGIDAESMEEETMHFEKLWGGELHRRAFERALLKK